MSTDHCNLETHDVIPHNISLAESKFKLYIVIDVLQISGIKCYFYKVHYSADKELVDIYLH